MVCPMCVTAAVVANLPAIGAAVGGMAAVKLAMGQQAKARSGPPVAPSKLVSDTEGPEEGIRMAAKPVHGVRRAPNPMRYGTWDEDYE